MLNCQEQTYLKCWFLAISACIALNYIPAHISQTLLVASALIITVHYLRIFRHHSQPHAVEDAAAEDLGTQVRVCINVINDPTCSMTWTISTIDFQHAHITAFKEMDGATCRRH